MKSYKKLLLLLSMLFVTASLFAEGDKTNDLRKVDGIPSYTKFNINNIRTWIFNNGRSDHRDNGNSGFEYPKGSNNAVFYESGLVYGGKINGEIRVGGSSYAQGQVPGRILENGTAEDTSLSSVRIYKVRNDYKTSDFIDELEYSYKYGRNKYDEYVKIDSIPILTAEELREQYEKDWNEWPARFGAPYEDIDNDGVYNPSIDKPGIPGADQTIWFVCNDLDEDVCKSMYGSSPIGIEMQGTFWGYKSPGPLGNMMFRKYVIINKGSFDVDDMYVSMWCDSEIGDATDDFVGCDTLINMGYGYNGDDEDYSYGHFVPAAGFVLLQGPVVNGDESEHADFLGRKVQGMKNLDMTSFHYIYKCCGPGGSGDLSYGEYESSIGFYNYFQGLTRIGTPFPIPDIIGGGITKFPFSGDPITGTGFIDGLTSGPADRRFAIGSGPFNLAVGDTQEVIYAQIAAGGTPEVSRLEAVKSLRYYSNEAKELFKKGFSFSKISSEKKPLLSLVNKEAAGDIKLSWDYEFNREEIESIEQNGYKFQGYNLYQTHLNNSLLPDEKKVKVISYDVIDGIRDVEGYVPNPQSGYAQRGIIQSAEDNGIKRDFVITKDYFTNLPLAKGKKYYFSLTAYYYNSDEQTIIESPNSTVEFIYKEFYKGPSFQDTIFVKGNSLSTSGFIFCNVAVPELLTGDNYKIEFTGSNDNLKWNVFDETINSYLQTDQNIISYPDYKLSSYDLNPPIFDGIQFKVVSPDPDAVQSGGIVEIAYRGGELPENGWDQAGSKFKGNSVLNNANWDNSGSRDSYLVYYDLRWKGFYEEMNKSYRDFEIRFTDNQNYAFGYYRYDSLFVVSVPFEIWDIGINTPDDPSDDVRLIPRVDTYRKNDITLTINSETSGYYYDSNCSKSIYFYDPEVIDGYSKFESEAEKAGGAGALYPYRNDGSSSGIWVNIPAGKSLQSAKLIDHFNFCDLDNDGEWPEAGTVVRIITEKPFKSGEYYSFKTPDNKIELESYSLFQNYPNPFNASTTIRFFMPENGNVKIDMFNILGQKVKTILNEKFSAGTHEKVFDTENLASGVYIYKLSVDNRFTQIKKMVLLK